MQDGHPGERAAAEPGQQHEGQHAGQRAQAQPLRAPAGEQALMVASRWQPVGEGRHRIQRRSRHGFHAVRARAWVLCTSGGVAAAWLAAVLAACRPLAGRPGPSTADIQDGSEIKYSLDSPMRKCSYHS